MQGARRRAGLPLPKNTARQLLRNRDVRVRSGSSQRTRGMEKSSQATEAGRGNACTPVIEFNALRTSANRHECAAVLLKVPDNVTCAPPLDAASRGSTPLILSPVHACGVSPSRRRRSFPRELRPLALACGDFGFATFTVHAHGAADT